MAAANVEKHADVMGGVGRALAKTTRFALTNPVAAVQLVWERHPETRPGDGDRERVLRRDVEIMRARLETLDPVGTRDPRWGVIARDEIVAWQDFLPLRERLDPAVYYTNAHVDRFNDFDAWQVIASAASFSRQAG